MNIYVGDDDDRAEKSSKKNEKGEAAKWRERSNQEVSGKRVRVGLTISLIFG